MNFDSTVTSEIIDYYYDYYLANCTTTRTFFTSWSGLSICSHSILLFLPLHLLGTYSIFEKTPKNMKSAKIFLLNTHFWTSFSDIMMCSLVTPFLFFPMIAGFPVGFLRVFNVPSSVQVYFSINVLMLMGFSMCLLSENRYNSILYNKLRIKNENFRKFWYFLNIFPSFLYPLPVLLNPPNQSLARLALLKRIPCPAVEFFDSPVFFVLTADEHLYYFAFVIVSHTTMIFGQIIFFGNVTAYYLYISPNNNSNRTQQMQRAFFISMLIQFMIPFLFILVPVAAGLFCVLTNAYSQFFNNLAVISFSIHGLASTITILCTYPSYRSFIKQLLRQPFEYGHNRKLWQTRSSIKI